MPKQKLDINYSYQKAASYSQYSIYSQCPFQWYLSYIKKQSVFSHSIYTVYGSAMHSTIQTYLKSMYDESIKVANEIDLDLLLETNLIKEYKQSVEDNKGSHFSTKEELKEFLTDGQATLLWFKKNRDRYFSKKTSQLIGIEVPILQPINQETPNILMNGFIDLIMYEKNTESYTIYDIKTSTRGWSDKDKKNQTKINQILLYKRFYSKVMNIPEDKIDVKLFIVKRKIYEKSEFPIHRVQEFIPANGKKKVEDAYQSFLKFVKACYTPDAKYNTAGVYLKNNTSCKFCPYNNRPDLCDKIN